MRLVDLSHEEKVGRRDRARQVINRAARDPGGLGLLGDAQRAIAADLGFAFSNPALLSAPSKKLVPGPIGDRSPRPAGSPPSAPVQVTLPPCISGVWEKRYPLNERRAATLKGG